MATVARNRPGTDALGRVLARSVRDRAESELIGRPRTARHIGPGQVESRAPEIAEDRDGNGESVLGVVGTGGGRVLQRLVVGEDPLADLSRPEARGLIYGMSSARHLTSHRLAAQDASLGMPARYRTIDAYNLALGINARFSDTKASATGIFKVREALRETNPVAAWRTHFPAATGDPTTDDDLAAWISCMKDSETYIGLYDLGSPEGEGATRIQAKHRFTKNLLSAQWATATTLTPERISDWLRSNRSYDNAVKRLDRKFGGRDEQRDLGKWIFSAFFRRTSKLGIDFTIARGHVIHMNIAADPTFDPSHAALPNVQERGLETLQDVNREQAYGRAITSSEFRHARKRAAAGPGRVNFYSEIRDPVVPLPGPPAAPKKKSWWRKLWRY